MSISALDGVVNHPPKEESHLQNTQTKENVKSDFGSRRDFQLPNHVQGETNEGNITKSVDTLRHGNDEALSLAIDSLRETEVSLSTRRHRSYPCDDLLSSTSSEAVESVTTARFWPDRLSLQVRRHRSRLDAHRGHELTSRWGHDQDLYPRTGREVGRFAFL